MVLLKPPRETPTSDSAVPTDGAAPQQPPPCPQTSLPLAQVCAPTPTLPGKSQARTPQILAQPPATQTHIPSRITSGSSRGGRAPAPNSPRALSIPKRCRAPRTGWILHRGCLFGRFMCQPSAAPHPFSSSASQPRARRSFSRLLQSFWDRSHAEPAGCRSCRSHGWSTAHKPQPYTQQGSSPAFQGGKKGTLLISFCTSHPIQPLPFPLFSSLHLPHRRGRLP